MTRLVFAALLLLSACAGFAAERLPRLAIVPFDRVAGARAETVEAAALCEAVLLKELARDPAIELIERGEIAKIIGEHQLAADGLADATVRLGQLLGADLLLLVRATEVPGAAGRAEATLLEVASGNILATAGAELSEPVDEPARRLAAALAESLPATLRAVAADRDKPGVAVLTVKNLSRLPRLTYLAPAIGAAVEETVAALGRYRVLRRQHPGVAGAETDLSMSGWMRPSDAVVAARANIVITIEYKETEQHDVVFDETPLELVATLKRGAAVERLAVAGKVRELSPLLKSLLAKIAGALGSDPAGAVPAPGLAEAAGLLREAVGETSGLDESVMSPEADRARRVELLERALYLDPNLATARYYLGCHFARSGYGGRTPEKWFQLQRAMQELERFLKAGIEPALRRRAMYELIYGYAYMGKSARTIAQSAPALTAQEKLEFTARSLPAWRRTIEVLTEYLREPPRKLLSTQEHWVGTIYYRDVALDPDGVTRWLLFVDSIYGKEHDQFNVSCPFIDAAKYALLAGRPAEALKLYERAMAEHGHSPVEEVHWGIHDPAVLAEIYRALKRPRDAARIDHLAAEKEKALNAGQEAQEAAQRKEALHGVAERKIARPEPPPLPAAAVLGAFPLPEGYRPRLARRVDSETWIFASKEQGLKGWGGIEDQYRRVYQEQKLFRWPRGAAEAGEVEMRPGRKTPRVCTIVPDGDALWFGTYEGLARFEPATKRWKWFTASEGLPTNAIVCGLSWRGQLWFGGGDGYNRAALFSIDPKTEAIRTCLPTLNLEWQSIVSLVPYENGFLSDNQRIYRIDPVGGQWTMVEQNKTARISALIVQVGDRFWSGSETGLAFLDRATPGATFRIFDAALSYGPADHSNPDFVTSLATDGELLWIGQSAYLTAYDPKRELWYGPVRLPDWARLMSAVGDELWIMGDAPLRISRAEFLKAVPGRSTPAVEDKNAKP